MSKPKVLITRPDIPQQTIDRLREHCDVQVYGKENPIPKEELMEMIKGKDGILCLKTDHINKQVIEAAGSQLKIISIMSSGYENVDVDECLANNIRVSNTPRVESAAVAEWTITLMICASRYFMDAVTAVKNGNWGYGWSPMWLCGQGIQDSVVGIVGMGGIGQMIVKRLLPFGVKKILYFDIRKPIQSADEMGCIFTEFEELLECSDFVVSMVSQSEEAENMFNAEAFKRMKRTAVFVNTSIGCVVEHADLYTALKEKWIRGAAIDVMVPEPLPKDHQLLELDNLIITPHVASADTGVRVRMAELAADNLLLGLRGEKTPVNQDTESVQGNVPA